jgi:hypothetical protein
VKTIRKSRAKESAEGFGDSAVLDLPHGAELKIKAAKGFDPKFGEDGALWAANISTRFVVVDGHTEEGEDDGKEFTDRFDLKVDLDILDELGLDDDDLKDMKKSDFSKKQIKALLDPDSWTIRDGSKPDKMNTALFGKNWAKKGFHPDNWIDKSLIAKVHPRTGKRPGSFTGWDSYMSIHPPKKTKKEKAEGEAAQKATDAELDELPDAPW